jgi:hypothetical protein
MVVSFVLLLLGFCCYVHSFAIVPTRDSQLEPVAANALVQSTVTTGCYWRQTGNCDGTLNGPREPSNDKDCSVTIPSGWSGFCECGTNVYVQYSNCGHANFTCSTFCNGQPTIYSVLTSSSNNLVRAQVTSGTPWSGFIPTNVVFIAFKTQVPGTTPVSIAVPDPLANPPVPDRQFAWLGPQSSVCCYWSWTETIYVYGSAVTGTQEIIVTQNSTTQQRINVFTTSSVIDRSTWVDRFRFYAFKAPPTVYNVYSASNPMRAQILASGSDIPSGFTRIDTFNAYQVQVPGTKPITTAVPTGGAIPDRQMAWLGSQSSVCCWWTFKETFYAYDTSAAGRTQFIVAQNTTPEQRIFVFGSVSMDSSWTERFRFFTPTTI